MTKKDTIESETAQAELDKLRAEVAQLRAAQSPLQSWLRTISSVIGVLSVSAGVISVAIAAYTSLRAEARLKEAGATETDVRVVSLYLNDVLPRASGAAASQLSVSCFDEHVKAGEAALAASDKCTGATFLPRDVQVAAYWSAVELSRRYSILCPSTRNVLEDRSAGDGDAKKALDSMSACP